MYENNEENEKGKEETPSKRKRLFENWKIFEGGIGLKEKGGKTVIDRKKEDIKHDKKKTTNNIQNIKRMFEGKVEGNSKETEGKREGKVELIVGKEENGIPEVKEKRNSKHIYEINSKTVKKRNVGTSRNLKIKREEKETLITFERRKSKLKEEFSSNKELEIEGKVTSSGGISVDSTIVFEPVVDEICADQLRSRLVLADKNQSEGGLADSSVGNMVGLGRIEDELINKYEIKTKSQPSE